MKVSRTINRCVEVPKEDDSSEEATTANTATQMTEEKDELSTDVPPNETETEKGEPKPKPPPCIGYEELNYLSRTMHFADFKKCVQQRSFIPSKVRKEYQTLLPKNGDFVWFRAESEDSNSDKNDWFGNIRCSFDLNQLLKQSPNVNLFYIDCAYFGYSSASRILLSGCSEYSNAKKIDLKSLKFGDPLLLNGDKLMFLKKDVSANQKWYGNHQTEFVVDAQTISLEKLFAASDKVVVNHSGANKLNKNNGLVGHRCLIYNSSRRKLCPSAWNKKVTQEIIDVMYAHLDKEKTSSKKKKASTKKTEILA